MKIILTSNGFAGIKPAPKPSKNPDGSFTVKLSPADFKIFQMNQAQQQQAPAAEAPVSDDSVSASIDPKSRH